MENIIFTIIESLSCFIFGIWLISDPEKNSKRFRFGIFISIISIILPMVSSFSTEDIFLNIFSIIIFIVFAVIIIQGIVFIENDPISVAVITKYGEIDWKKGKETVSVVTKDHGYRFLFLRGIVYNHILIPIEKINVDLGEQKVITPDNAVNFVPVQYTYTPGPNFYNFIKAGKRKMEEILNDQVKEKIRIWASSDKEGPKTWQDMRGAGDEAISVLIKLIAGDNLTPINSDIPTWRLFQFYEKVPFYPSEKNETEGQIIEEIKGKIEALSEKERDSLKKRINDRWEIIRKLRQGNGTQKIDSLGITLNRFNVGQIRVDEEIEKAIKRRSIETAEAEGEKIELDNVKARIFELMFELDDNGKPVKKDGNYVKTGISEQQAIELIQSERGKVQKKIDVNRTELAFDKTTLQMVQTLAIAIIEAIKKGG